MILKKFGDHKIYKGLLSVEAVYDNDGLVVALALIQTLWFGRKQILRYWPLVKPVPLDVVRQRKFGLDELFGSGTNKKSRPLDTRERKERRINANNKK